jgi:hypothetical protein
MRLEDKVAAVRAAGGIDEQATPLSFVTQLVRAWREASWLIRFPVTALAGVAAIVALCWVAFGFGSLGLDATATFAAVIGITLTVGLGVGLMTLIFYSDRSGRDDIARGDITERDSH